MIEVNVLIVLVVVLIKAIGRFRVGICVKAGAKVAVRVERLRVRLIRIVVDGHLKAGPIIIVIVVLATIVVRVSVQRDRLLLLLLIDAGKKWINRRLLLIGDNERIRVVEGLSGDGGQRLLPLVVAQCGQNAGLGGRNRLILVASLLVLAELGGRRQRIHIQLLVVLDDELAAGLLVSHGSGWRRLSDHVFEAFHGLIALGRLKVFHFGEQVE